MQHFSGWQKALSIPLKLIVALSALVGTYLSAMAGEGSFMGGTRVMMYFTIQSNLAIAALCGVGIWLMLRKRPVGPGWYLIKFVGTVSITLTGVVFCFVLAPTMGAYAWSLPNVLTHVVVPLAAVADFFVTGVNGRLKYRDSLFVTAPPILYAVYAGIGFVCNWQFAEGINYPYFFLNWGSPAGAFGFTDDYPFMGCMWWILLLLLFLIGVACLYLLALNGLKKAQKRG